MKKDVLRPGLSTTVTSVWHYALARGTVTPTTGDRFVCDRILLSFALLLALSCCLASAQTANPFQIQAVSPFPGSNPAGSAEVFTISYTALRNNLSSAYFNVSPDGASSVNSCFLTYYAPLGTISLRDDSNQDTPVMPGSNTIVSNSRCSLDGSTSSVQANGGNNYVISFALRFTNAYAGIQKLWAMGVDTSIQASPWTQVGSYSVQPAGPFNILASPGAGSGSAQVFTVSYSDAHGIADISSLYFNVSRGGANAQASCFLSYSPPPPTTPSTVGTIALRDDADRNWLQVKPGSTDLVGNSQCSLDGSVSSIQPTQESDSSRGYIVSFGLRFKSDYLGTQHLWAMGTGASNQPSAWQSVGSYTVQSPGVFNNLLSRVSGGISEQIFTVSYSDVVGASDISSVYFAVSNPLSGRGSCFLTYVPSQSTVNLRDDLDQNWLPITIPTDHSISNSQCVLDGAVTSVLRRDDGYILTLGLRFRSAYTGAKSLWAMGVRTSIQASPWQTFGTYFAYPGIETEDTSFMKTNADTSSFTNGYNIAYGQAHNGHPTALYEAATARVWWCGVGPYGQLENGTIVPSFGDSTWHADLNPGGFSALPALELGWNGNYLPWSPYRSIGCTPSVIKLPDSVHIYADPFPPGGSRYQMFFECTIGSKNSNTNVCTAVSQDAANWYIWGFAPGDPPEKRSWLPWQVGVVVPIILATLPDGVTPLPACDLLDPQQSNQCSYGVGYPSAVVMGGEVWIYYYSQTDGPVATSGTGYIARARTTDGVHLTAPEKTSIFAHNLQDPRIYVLDTYRGQFFMATAGQLGGDSPYYNPALPEKGNYFALSTDGLTFESIFRSQT